MSDTQALRDVVSKLLADIGDHATELDRHLCLCFALLQRNLLSASAITETVQLGQALVRLAEMLRVRQATKPLNIARIEHVIVDVSDRQRPRIIDARVEPPAPKLPRADIDDLPILPDDDDDDEPAEKPRPRIKRRPVAADTKPPPPAANIKKSEAERNCEDWVDPRTGKIIRGSRPCTVDFAKLERERALPEGMTRKRVGPPRIW